MEHSFLRFEKQTSRIHLVFNSFIFFSMLYYKMRVTVRKQISRKGKASRAYSKMKGRKPAQNKFKLARPSRKQVRNVSDMAECVKFTGWINTPDPKILPIQQTFLSTTASATFIPIHAFWYMRAKRDIPILNNAVEGRDVFSKYLQSKLEIKYPESLFGPKGGTRPLEVVYGWVTPLNLTDRTQPAENTVTAAEILEHVLDQIAQDFDSTNDTMEFKDKRRRSYNIVGRFKVKPNQNALLPSAITSTASPGNVADAMSFEGDIPPLRRNVNWKMMKKVRYTRSTQGIDPSEGDTDPILYPNQAYIPFLMLYNPDHYNYSPNTTDDSGNIQIKQIKVRYNSCHWFNDF